MNGSAESVIQGYCRTAQLSPVQTEAVLLHLVDGLTAKEIRWKLHLKRVAQVQALLAVSLQRLGALAGWREVLLAVVSPEQFRRLRRDDEREPTTEEVMRGPRPAQAPTPQVGRTWTEVCFLPGAPRREGVPVLMAETVRRWW